jgi:hypothetical protein
MTELLSWEKDFPPTVIQFRILCLPTTISPDGKNSAAYIGFNDESHPEYKAKQLESDEAKGRRKQAGESALGSLKDLF